MKAKSLKTLLLLGLTITALNSTVMAQTEKKYKEVNILKTSEVINISADSLWKIVRQFDQVGVWFSSIDHAEVSGEPEFEGATCSERTCYVNLRGYSEVHEKLTLFDDPKRELAYAFTGGGPSFLLFAGNHWSVSEVGPNQSVLTMEATMRLKRFAGFLFGGKLKRTIEKSLPESLNELKVYAETGEVSEAKKARIQALKKKKGRKAA